jgi:predicted permease
VTFGHVRRGIRRLFRLGVHHPRFARADAEEELRAFVAARVEKLTAAGLTPAEAHQEALRRLGGNWEQALEDVVRSAELREKEMSVRDYIDDLRDDLTFARRSFRREKLVAAFIVVTLALGIGANAAMYSVIERLLIRGPEHISDADRVMRFFRTESRIPEGDRTTHYFGWVSYDVFRRDTSSFAAVGAYTVYSQGFTFGEGADAVLVPYGAATWDLFPLLGVRPALGRFFTAQEDAPAAPQPVVVLGYGLWRRAFGADSGVIGRTATFGATSYTIVGVAPRGFTGPQFGPVDAWIPLAYQSRNVTDNWPTSWNAQWLRVLARLKPGISREQVATAATTAYRSAYTGTDRSEAASRIFVAPLNSDSQGRETPEAAISRWLIGVTLVVLLIACSNVANLLLARAVRRRREVAVRIALGAGRGRLLRLLLTESTALAIAGSTAGLAVAWVMATLMRNVLLPGLEWPSAPVNMRVLGVSLVIACGVGLLTGMLPALRASRPDLTASLKSGVREGGGQSSRLRGALTIVQAALSIVLLVGAGLFVRSLGRIHAIDLGIEPDRIVVVQVRYPTSIDAAGERERRTQVLQDAMLRARSLPSVEHSTLTIGLPFQSSFELYVRVEGWDSLPRLEGGGASIRAVADGYFNTVGTSVLEGRAFTLNDRDGSEPVAIVNRTMATTLWPRRSPLGECIYWGGSQDSLTTCSRIVGVAADAHSFALREGAQMTYYVPFGQERGMGGTSLLVRPKSGRTSESIAAIRMLMLELDPAITFVNAELLQDSVDPEVRPWKLGAVMFTMLGALALAVAAVGLYSVMSYLVAQRTHEFGVRIALGAQTSVIMVSVLRGSALMALAGVMIGSGIALAMGRFVEPLLFDTSPRDPLVLSAVGATLVVVAVLASVVPAIRAKRVNPMEALRAE